MISQYRLTLESFFIAGQEMIAAMMPLTIFAHVYKLLACHGAAF